MKLRPLLLGLAFSGPVSGQILHVDDTATGANDGTSWLDAFTDLQSALAVAGPSDQIWVARGTYKPTSTLDRTATFEIDCEVYGGFDGTEASLADRAGLFDETTLSGDLLGDDGPGFASNGENSLHVAYVPTFLFHTIVLDGFTVRGGNANSSPYAIGGGLFVEFFTSYVHVRNCTFADNLAVRGGGVGCPGKSYLRIERCRFVGNRSRTYGGGIDGGADTEIRSCTFVGNRARLGGGGLSFAVLAADCIFSGNEASAEGGGAYGTDSVSNCTFSRNRASLGGGFVSSTLTTPIRNCVLWENEDDTGRTQSGQVSGSVIASSCIVQGWDGSIPGARSFDADPLFRLPLGADGVAGSLDDDLNLEPGSPCVDTGDASGYDGLGVDARGRPRFVDSLACDAYGVLDRGAIERGHDDVDTVFCESTKTSLGVPAEVSGECHVSEPTLLFATPVPDAGGNAFLLLGSPGARMPFGDGYLCLAGTLRRTPSVGHSGSSITFLCDPRSPPWSEVLRPGATIGIQALFRDVAAGGTGFNLSSAMRLLALP